MIIILLGPQGSGKGTQAKLLAEKYNLTYIDMGSIFRELAKTDKELARKLATGELLPDSFAVRTLIDFLQEKKAADNIIMDGFPRRLNQYIELKRRLRMPDIAIFINVSREESVKRLENRRYDPVTGKVYNLETNPPPPGTDVGKLVAREDDKPAAIEQRLKDYEADTKPLIEYLEEDGILFNIDGERPIPAIHKDIVQIVENKINGKN